MTTLHSSFDHRSKGKQHLDHGHHRGGLQPGRGHRRRRAQGTGMPRRPAQAAPRRRLSDHPRRLCGAHRTQRALDDWRSSIIDGRLASQRARAEQLFKEAGVKLVYILEGNMPTWTTEYIYGVQNKALASSILLTSLRDDYHVVHAPTLASTAAVIAHVAVQLASGGLKPKPVSAAAGVLGKGLVISRLPSHLWLLPSPPSLAYRSRRQSCSLPSSSPPQTWSRRPKMRWRTRRSRVAGALGTWLQSV